MPPVIVLSAVDDVAATVQALDAGAIDYVNKPFHTAELAARVRRHLTTPTPGHRPSSGSCAGAGSSSTWIVGGHASVTSSSSASPNGSSRSLRT